VVLREEDKREVSAGPDVSVDVPWKQESINVPGKFSSITSL
jgi:hypothetical protein